MLGGRLDARTSRGDVPFYQLPYVDLRGIPAARYQDQNAGVGRGRAALERDAALGAGRLPGAGRAWGSSTSFSDADTVTSRGVGFRYLVARRLGIYMGLDVARRPGRHRLLHPGGQRLALTAVISPSAMMAASRTLHAWCGMK